MYHDLSGLVEMPMSAATRNAIFQLEPTKSSSQAEKFTLNRMGCSDTEDKSGLFIIMSRCNHDCLENSECFTDLFYERHLWEKK